MKKKGIFLTLFILSLPFVVACSGSSTEPDYFDIGENDPNIIVGFGDSITYGVNSEIGGYLPTLEEYMHKDHPELTIINEGIPGTTSFQGVQRIKGVLESDKPAVILIMYGTNDQTFGYPKEKSLTYNNLQYMVDIARENNTIPVIATIPFACYGYEFMADDVANMNEMIRNLAKTEEVVLADVYETFNENGGCELINAEQGNHPTDDGYRLIAEVFFKSLESIAW